MRLETTTLSTLTLNRMGLEVVSGEFSAPAKLVLHLWATIPGSVRERFVFSGLKSDMLIQKALQFCLKGPKPVKMKITEGFLNGLYFEALSSHKYFLLGTTFEHRLQKRLAQIVTPNDIVYDIGAHFGWWTLWFSQRCRHVVAFEPSPTNFPVLAANIASNHLFNVTLHKFAASNQQGTISFVEKGSYSHLGSNELKDEGLPKVKTIRIDDCIGDPPPTFVKVDVEGHAASVLEGMHSTLSNRKPRLACELHHAAEEYAVLAILKSHVYQIRSLESGAEFPKHILADATVG